MNDMNSVFYVPKNSFSSLQWIKQVKITTMTSCLNRSLANSILFNLIRMVGRRVRISAVGPYAYDGRIIRS
jgi:hypothetical protein